MNTKTKSIFVISGVLILGIIIGTFGSTVIRRNLLDKRIEQFRSPRGFGNHIERIIEPEAHQIQAIEDVINKHHEKMQNISNQFRDRMKGNMDSLLKDLEPVLSPEQFDRLKERLKDRRQPFGRERRNSKKRSDFKKDKIKSNDQ